MKKEKKYIAPNECSLGRWIAVLVVGLLVGVVLSVPLSPFTQNQVDSFMGISYGELFGILTFAPLFFGMVFAIKVLGKTSMKDFVLGVNGSVNKKECMTVLGLYALGFALPHLLILGNIRLRGIDPVQFGALVVIMLLVTWMQTTWEELIFRGIAIRWACKNQVGFTRKAIIGCVVSTVAFALAHITNPEVTSQSGFQVVLAVVTYMIPGVVCYIANLHFGSLVPGILLHWLNNFLLFTLISSDVSALAFPTLLVDSTPHSGVWALASTAMAYLPVLVYIFLDAKKQKTAAN